VLNYDEVLQFVRLTQYVQVEKMPFSKRTTLTASPFQKVCLTAKRDWKRSRARDGLEAVIFRRPTLGLTKCGTTHECLLRRATPQHPEVDANDSNGPILARNVLCCGQMLRRIRSRLGVLGANLTDAPTAFSRSILLHLASLKVRNCSGNICVVNNVKIADTSSLPRFSKWCIFWI
jgi:hypothetical protein